MPFSSTVLSISVALLGPAGVAVDTSCSFAATAQVKATVLDAATNVTQANAGAPSCGSAPAARRALQAGGGGNCSTSSTAAYTFYVPIIVPPGGSATAAQSAITALGGGAFSSTLAILANSSGCASAAFSFGAPIVTAARCGTAGDSGVRCLLPASSASQLNTGGLIGGLVGGGALLIIFVTLVLVLRGECHRCGACCPQRRDEAAAAEASPPAEAKPPPPAAAAVVAV